MLLKGALNEELMADAQSMANYGKRIYHENSKHIRQNLAWNICTRNPKGVKFGIIELASEFFLEEENRRNDLCSSNVDFKIKFINYSIGKTTDFSLYRFCWKVI